MSYTRERILKMYRHILKHGRFYPSLNRVEILASVSEFFHQSKNVTDPAELKERTKMAEMILANFRMYHAKVIELRTDTRIKKPVDEESINTPGEDFIYF